MWCANKQQIMVEFVLVEFLHGLVAQSDIPYLETSGKQSNNCSKDQR
jgi:hypothetical protein